MQTLSFKIRTLAPLSHGAYKEGLETGNSMGFRRLPIISQDGEVYNVPVLSGNSLRGVMRRTLTQEYMNKLGIKNDKMYIALANGGALGKALDGYIRPEKTAKIRRTFPILSAFGSALFSFMLPGTCCLNFAILECAELGTGKHKISMQLTDIGQTRHIERGKIDYDSIDVGIKPMPYTMEAIMPGSIFDCSVHFLNEASDLDKAVVSHGLNLIKVLGGKSASGFGFVELDTRFDDSLYLEWLDNLGNEDAEEAAKVIAEL